MKWNEILTIWFWFQVGSLMSLMFGVSVKTIVSSLIFSGLFAVYLAGIEYFRSEKNGS